MSIIKVITTAFKWVFLVLLAYILFVEVVLRIVRRFYQFPIPAFVARLIDNPIRRCIQPPEKIVEWMGVEQGMAILEIGPGPGTFTLEAGRQVGDKGRVYAIDIQESIVSSLGQKIEQQGIINIIVEQASAYDLPYPHSYFDLVYMIAVLGEIPDKKRALAEFRRVLKDDGLLAISEFLPDPDFPRRKTVTAWCQDAGFVLADTYGNLMHYLLLFSNKQ